MPCLKDSLHNAFVTASVALLLAEQPVVPMMIVLTDDDKLVTVVFTDHSVIEMVSPGVAALFPGQAIMAHFLLDGVAFSISRLGTEPETRMTVLDNNGSQVLPPQEVLDFFSKE
jgi:hypothetical protein